MGDFNARTHNLDDVLNGEKSEDTLDQVDFFSKIQTSRNNQDQSSNNLGRRLTEYCIATRSYIANGRTIGELNGEYTCHEYSGSSTVDYAIINENMMNMIQSFQVLDPNTGSDHSPIKLNLFLRSKPNQSKNNGTELPPKIIWNNDTKLKFELKINSREALDKINEMHNALNSKDDNTDDVISDHVKLLLPAQQKRKKADRKRKAPKKWYDHTCHEMSRRLKDITKLFTKSPTIPHLRASYCKTRKDYKKLLKFKKQEWMMEMISKLENLEKERPKECWKIVNELREKQHKETWFNTANFMKFFENLYSKTELFKAGSTFFFFFESE